METTVWATFKAVFRFQPISCGYTQSIDILNQQPCCEFLCRPRIDEGYCLVEEIEEGGVFQISDGRVFKRVKKLRKRIQAIEITTGRMYLFSPIFEVLKRTGS